MTQTSLLDHLECALCLRRYAAERPAGLCACGRPLLARYRVGGGQLEDWRRSLAARAPGLWRYEELLPPAARRITLGEGNSLLLAAPPSWPAKYGVGELGFKWEGGQPTGSFKARGMSVAISRALHFGAQRLVVPTAGNAGVAAAAYAREACLPLDVFMPSDTDPTLIAAARDLGALVHTVDGTLSDCGREAARLAAEGIWNLSTLREPYRLEGKKTMGFELWEAGPLPDVIVYPTGGGTGLLGLWKAFTELREAGLLAGALPRLVCVQMAGCAPLCRAFQAGHESAAPWHEPTTDVFGLRVPQALGDVLILRALRETDGQAVIVEEADAFAATQELDQALAIDAAPEAGAALAGLGRLRDLGLLAGEERVVVLLTGSGHHYAQLLARHGIRRPAPPTP